MADSPDLPPLSPDPAPAEVAPSPPAPGPSAPSATPKRGFGAGVHALWTLAVRLVILGTGVGVGWLVGMVVAQAIPARNSEPPLAEVALRYSSQTLRKLRQLPGWWQGSRTAPAEDALGAAAQGDSAASPATVPPAPLPSLSEGDRDRIAADLNRLRQDLSTADDRLVELEDALGVTANGTLADRLQRLDQRLAPEPDEPDQPSVPAPEATPEPASPSSAAQAPYQEPRFPLVRDRVVLPSVLLFEPGTSTLTEPGQQLLDSIVPDLRRYGSATLLVGSHTDGAVAPDLASQLTLQQSLTVQQYLAPQLEASGSRWVALGYGHTRPSTAGTSPADQQRNQRVEIGIVPGS